MRRGWRMGVLAMALALGTACGGPEGGLPGPGGDGAGTDPGAHTPPETSTSLWPLTTGSTWTYRITDEVLGTFEKKVEVLGPREVPGASGVTAIAVANDEPTIDELTFELVDEDGLVLRIREEDSKNGALARVTRWDPSTVKAIAEERPAGWERTSTATETEESPSGAVLDSKEKSYAWTVVATHEQVTVPAGTFPNALHLKRTRTDKPDYLREYWLVPGVGKVRETGERTEELVKFDVKP